MNLEDYPTTKKTFNEWVKRQGEVQNECNDADNLGLLFKSKLIQEFKSDTCKITDPIQICCHTFELPEVHRTNA